MIAASQDVAMGQAGGGAAQGKQDIAGGGVAEDIKSPYLTLEGIKGKQATLVFARMETAKDYHSPQLVLKVTMERLEAMNWREWTAARWRTPGCGVRAPQ